MSNTAVNTDTERRARQPAREKKIPDSDDCTVTPSSARVVESRTLVQVSMTTPIPGQWTEITEFPLGNGYRRLSFEKLESYINGTSETARLEV